MNGEWGYVAAIVSAAAILFSAFAYYFSRISSLKDEYRHDKLRLELERQLNELSSRLQSDKARFESINHLILDAQRLDRKPKQQINFVSSNALIRDLEIDSTQVDPKLVLVLTPFNPQFEADWLAIKESVASVGFTATRGDDDYKSSNILKHILERMVAARLVIANISGRNPNVFYELGIAHSLGKPVVIISRNADEIPFDLGALRVLVYTETSDLKDKLSSWITHAILNHETPLDPRGY